MLISIRLIAGSKREAIVEEADGLKVYLRAPAVEGKANAALIEALAEHFGVSRSCVRIVRGERSRQKVVGIVGGEMP